MTDHGESENSKPFQVVDRRRFDSAGNERDESSAAPVFVKQAADPGLSNAASGEPSGEEETETGMETEADPHQHAGAFRMGDVPFEEGDVTFTSFVMSMATQALMQMGEMDAPPGMEIPIDVESARQTIDILSMLQRKTRGNLSSEEARFMEEVLHTLRMSYVRRAK